MAMDRGALELLGREQLIQEARRFGVRRPEVMTRVELIDEVLRLGTPNPAERKRVRGWLGVARDLVASVVEQGLNLPDAAALIRGDFRFEPLKPVQPPVATVTLAEIYGAQGHFQKALSMLDEVLAKEPDHEAARKLRDRLERDRIAGSRAAAIAPTGAAVFPEEPEPSTERKPGEGLPSFATAHVAPGVPGVPPGEQYGEGGRAGTIEEEPLTPRRLSLQPPPRAATIADYDSEPLTPRRLSTKTTIAAPKEEAEPPTPRHAPKPPEDVQRAELAPGEDDGGAGRAGMTEDGRAGMSGVREVSPAEPDVLDDDAVLIRTSPTRAVVYFEVRERGDNGDAALLHLVEWRAGPSGVERIVHEQSIAGERGAVAVEGLQADSIVRAALGRRRHGRFKPFVVCAEATLGAASPTIVWSPRGRKDYAPVVERAASSITA